MVAWGQKDCCGRDEFLWKRQAGQHEGFWEWVGSGGAGQDPVKYWGRLAVGSSSQDDVAINCLCYATDSVN